MALDDRERNFEKALRRELKANGASGLDCPDAETLAAYHERMLSPEEMAAQKSHIAACPRCQEVLATLEVTEAIPSGVEDSEKVLAKTLELAGARARSGSLREMPKRKTYLRWAVPAGAIAAGLLVWISMNGGRSTKMAQTAPVQVAENREQKGQKGTAKPMEEAPAPTSEMTAPLSKNDRTYTEQELDALVSGDKTKPMERRQAGASGNYAHGPRMAQNQMQNQIQNNGKIAAQNKSADQFDYRASELPHAGRNEAVIVQNAPRPNEQTRAAVPAAPPPPAPSGAAKGGDLNARKDSDAQSAKEMIVVTGEAASVADEKREENAKTALKKLKAAPSQGGMTAARLRDTGEEGLVLIPTPDSKVFWFGGVNGLVLKTEDGGKTSQKQKIGEGIRVLAGSAVDAKTCWLIAEKGIVLRTVDGGKHWTTMAAPNVAEFTSIKATDALHATITDAHVQFRYTTSDGGATWSPQPLP